MISSGRRRNRCRFEPTADDEFYIMEKAMNTGKAVLDIRPGAMVEFNGICCVITNIVDLDTVLLTEVESRKTYQVKVAELSSITNEPSSAQDLNTIDAQE